MQICLHALLFKDAYNIVRIWFLKIFLSCACIHVHTWGCNTVEWLVLGHNHYFSLLLLAH